MFTATYSPDDNKLRLYAATRLPKDVYERVRAAGFIWAPKQELFVAPMWTPEREDLLIELAGEIGDEDTSLTERAEERAERFETYSEKRGADANRAREGAAALSEQFAFGQPILVGHHSEKRARKDAERIENGMRKAVKMWQTSRYWTDRAAGALRHAKYKELPNVRARRIKKIESDKRRVEKNIKQSQTALALWRNPGQLRKNGEPVELREAALWIANRFSRYELWSALNDGKITPEEASAKSITSHEGYIEHAKRWLAHYDNRLAYERAMLGESGYIEPPKAPTRAALPILNYAGTVEYRNPYHTSETVTVEARGMTSAEWAKINKDYKGTRISADGTHRVRTAMIRHELVCVFLTDKKQHPKPGAGEQTREQAEVDRRAREGREQIAQGIAKRAAVIQHNRALTGRVNDEPPKQSSGGSGPSQAPPSNDDAAAYRHTDKVRADDSAFKAMNDQLRDAKRENRPVISIVAAPQLFPTPPAIARRMVEEGAVQPGQRVLEPSAGTGSLIDALPDGTHVVAIEINNALCRRLNTMPKVATVIEADFLNMAGVTPDAEFDRIIMNPPFENGADIKHIQHAVKFLKPGGRLVALCANGPRQKEKLGALVDQHGGTWEDLPDGSFAESGTNVRVAMITLDKAA